MTTASKKSAGGIFRFFADQKIGVKIGLGFGVVLAIMVGISATAYLEFDTVERDVHAYSRIVNNTSNVTDIDRHFLAFRRYIGEVSNDMEENLKAAAKERDYVREHIAKALKETTHPERLAKLKHVSEQFDVYSKDFDKVAPMQRERAKLAQEIINPYGEKIEIDLLALQKNATALTGSSNLLILTSEAIKDAMELRLNVQKMLTRYDAALVQAAEKNFADLKKVFAAIDKEIKNPEVRRTYDEAVTLADKYHEAFRTIAHDSHEIDNLFNGEMRKAAQSLAADVEAIKASAVADEHRIENEVASMISWANTFILMIASGGFILGALFAWLIGRGIATPIRALTSGMRELAGGNFDVVLAGLGRKDEIGDIAGAVEEFKVMAAEKARREAEEKAEQDKRAAAERDAAMQKMAAEFEDAVGSLVKAAVAGDFTQRVDLQGKTGLVLNVGTALNSLCENVSKALDDLIRMLNSLAEGDLTRRITAAYEGNFAILKDNANRTAERIGETISEIKASAREVTNASAEISTSTTDLSQRTEEQAASLEETSASMEEIAATVKKNAENAQEANASAANTRQVADRGGQVVAQAVDAMAKIEESSRKISDIIGVIDEIARQTNLLALNAAVEAARAGDAGRGFAVVASEVRSLAQRSSQAAKDIKDLITNSNGQVKDGVDLVNRAGTALTEIVESIKKVADIVSDIANASAEQASGIEQVNKALTQMDEVTQQNSALVEENAATAKTLEQQAKAMNDQVAVFRLGEGGMGHSAKAGGLERKQAAA